MRKSAGLKLLILLVFALFINNLSIGQVVFSDWVISAGTRSWDIVNDIAFDGSHNIYITGSISDSANKSGKNGIAEYKKSLLFISRYDTAGNLIWSKNILKSEAGYGSRISTIGTSRVIISGGSEAAVKESSSHPGKYNFFISSLDTSGTIIWTQTFSCCKNDFITSMIVDTLKSEILLAGHFRDTLLIAGETFVSGGGDDGFLVSFDFNGEIKKVRIIGGKGLDNINCLSVSSEGDRFAAGTFQQTIRFSKDKALQLSNTKSVGGFLVKYNPAGDVMASKLLLAGKKLRITNMLTFGELQYVTGSFSDEVTINGNVLHSAGSDDIFLLCIDGDMQIKWFKQFGGTKKDRVAGIINSGKEILLTGSFCEEMKIGQHTLRASGKGGDVFLFSLNPSGVINWVRSLGGKGDDYPVGMVPGVDGYIYIAGSYRQSLNLNGKEVTSNGEEDIFICRLENCRLKAPTFKEPEFLCEGTGMKLDAGPGFTAYNWANGLGREHTFTIDQGGNYSLELLAPNGCILFDTIKVEEVQVPVVFLGNDTTLTDTALFLLNAGKGFTRYLWNNGNTSYLNLVKGAELQEGRNLVKVTVTNEKRCMGNDDIIINMVRTLPNQVSELVSESCMIFPNPTSDKVSVTFTMPFETLVLKVHDPMGKVLLSKSIPGYVKNSPVVIHLGALPAGLYTLHIKTDRGAASKKIILQ